jgi:hypothetical protein
MIMKKIFSILNLLSVLLIINSCRKPLKDVNDYFVKVKTVSAVIQQDGSVVVSGEIESPGKAKGTAVEYVGVCYSTNGDPKMLDHQIIGTLSGTTFTVTCPVSNFSVDSVYYFRTWATNDYGYSLGNIIKVDSIIATPVIAPCTVTMNTVNIGGGQPSSTYYTIDAPDGYNEFTATTYSGPTIHFKFGSAMTTGIFTTTTATSPYAGQVFVSFYSGFISGALSDGSKVYVNLVGPGCYEVQICAAPWNYSSSSTFYFNTHFVTPY